MPCTIWRSGITILGGPALERGINVCLFRLPLIVIAPPPGLSRYTCATRRCNRPSGRFKGLFAVAAATLIKGFPTRMTKCCCYATAALGIPHSSNSSFVLLFRARGNVNMHIVTPVSVSVCLRVIRFAGTRSGPVRSGLLHSTICRLTSLSRLTRNRRAPALTKRHNERI